MVVARLRVAVEDPLVAAEYGFGPENVQTGDEPFFLDGPVGARVAIVDRDPENGQLTAPAAWLASGRTYSTPDDPASPQSIAASVFGIVLETLAMFERQDVLGHKVRWAFDSPQLLVVPNAGIWANAFYDRYSRSLQFYSFDAEGGARVHTALSRDIVAHETGHAILDGLAPALYDALTPESLALHESIGDLAAMLMALQSRSIRDWLVRDHGGRLDGSTPVSQLANQFGWARRMNRPLRDANNSVTMSQAGQEPHDLSQVLTGAIWATMVRLHASALQRAQESPDSPAETTVGKALGISALRIARVLFRALDFLPPAEATFVDYARAVLRSDSVAYPIDETGYRETLTREFVERGIVAAPEDLIGAPAQPWLAVDLDNVLESDWVAYALAERERDLLGIPPGVPFRLFPRRDVKRQYYLGQGRHEVRREIVFQVTWEAQEDNGGIPGLPPRRAVFHGTTLVLSERTDDQGRHAVLSCLTSDRAARHEEGRSQMVRQLADRRQLDLAASWRTAALRPFAPNVFGRVADDTLRLRGTARLLHLAEPP